MWMLFNMPNMQTFITRKESELELPLFPGFTVVPFNWLLILVGLSLAL